MAKSTLPVNYQDDILNSAMSGKRRFKLINNSDGTVSLEDVTTYDQIGSNFGAGQMNATNQAVNESLDKNKVVRDLATISAITQAGYVPDALALKEVNDSLGRDESGMTIHEKLDNILDATVSSISPIIIDKRNHAAAGSTFSYTYTLNNAGNYRYLLILLAGFSNVANTVNNSLTTSSGTVLTLFTEYGETNGGACVSLGLYLIDNPTNGMTIEVYTTQSGIEKIWGI